MVTVTDRQVVHQERAAGQQFREGARVVFRHGCQQVGKGLGVLPLLGHAGRVPGSGPVADRHAGHRPILPLLSTPASSTSRGTSWSPRARPIQGRPGSRWPAASVSTQRPRGSAPTSSGS